MLFLFQSYLITVAALHLFLAKDLYKDFKELPTTKRKIKSFMEYLLLFWFPFLNSFCLFFLLYEFISDNIYKSRIRVLHQKFPCLASLEKLNAVFDLLEDYPSYSPFPKDEHYPEWTSEMRTMLFQLKGNYMDEEVSDLLLSYEKIFSELLDLSKEEESDEFLAVYRDSLDLFLLEYHSIIENKQTQGETAL